MTIRQLKERIQLSKLPDDAEVVVHADSNSRDYIVNQTRVEALGSRYFGGPEPESTEPNCLVLDID